MIYSAVGGGTGSGTTNLIIDRLSKEYPKLTSVGFTVIPPTNLQGTDIVAPYNATLCLGETSSRENLELDMWFDNEALFAFCSKNSTIE